MYIQAMHSLNVMAETMGKTVTEIMQPHKDVLQDMIPPKKHLLRYQPPNTQIGLMVNHCCLGKSTFKFSNVKVNTNITRNFFFLNYLRFYPLTL
jgi:hypothetical protein